MRGLPDLVVNRHEKGRLDPEAEALSYLHEGVTETDGNRRY